MDLGGFLPQRRRKADPWPSRPRQVRRPAEASGEAAAIHDDGHRAHRSIMLLKDKRVGRTSCPSCPTESRTFGMEGMFRQVGIWNQEGQNYVPEDHDQLMFYTGIEDRPGSPGRDQRSRRHERLDRRRHLVFRPWRADHSVLHLLPMFGLQRVPRPGVGCRRHARRGFPHRRHRRSYHAQRRRPAARTATA